MIYFEQIIISIFKLTISHEIFYWIYKDWRRTQTAKGKVCKTFIYRFESGRRLINNSLFDFLNTAKRPGGGIW